MAILRGDFHIPSRVVTGYTGSFDPEQPDFTHVVVPSQGHAWAEVYDENTLKWEEVDATPSTPDREKTHKQDKSQYESVHSPTPQSESEKPKDEEESNPSRSMSAGSRVITDTNWYRAALKAQYIYALEGALYSSSQALDRLSHLEDFVNDTRKESRGDPEITKFSRKIQDYE